MVGVVTFIRNTYERLSVGVGKIILLVINTGFLDRVGIKFV